MVALYDATKRQLGQLNLLNLYCYYIYPIDLAPKGIPFGVKSMGKV